MAKRTTSPDSVAQDQIRAFVERIERMEEERKAIADDIKEIYAEAKGNGFDTKVLRMVIRIRKQDHAERLEQDALLELYLAALGMNDGAQVDDDEDDDGPESSDLTEAVDQLDMLARKVGGISVTGVGLDGREVTVELGKDPT